MLPEELVALRRAKSTLPAWGALVLALILALISLVFRLGVALGYQTAADDLSWHHLTRERKTRSPDASG
jgi:hypothetical protein